MECPGHRRACLAGVGPDLANKLHPMERLGIHVARGSDAAAETVVGPKGAADRKIDIVRRDVRPAQSGEQS